MFLAARLSSKRAVFPTIARSASSATRPRGLAAILEKKPDDVVITFAKRTAVGRAKKGQLRDTPVDEILHALFKVFARFLV
jgi:dTDP-4-dehydrorhamnose reductase